MSFTLSLYNLKKKKNSTLRPTNATLAATYQCVLKDNTSILAPTFIVQTEANLNNMLSQGRYIMANYDSGDNYYYWLADMRSVCYGVWEIDGRLDPLATWKIEIGDTYAYIERCATVNNFDIIDPLEIYGNFYTTTQQQYDNPINISPNGGYYVLSLYNDLVNNFNEVGTNAYLVNGAQSLQTILLNIIYNNDKAFTDYYSNNKDVIAGIQYIPFNMQAWLNLIDIDVRVNGVDLGSAKAFRAGANTIFGNTVDIPLNRIQHNYRQHAPYTQYSIYLPYIGTIPLNDDMLGDKSNVRVNGTYDVVSGAIHYHVTAHSLGINDDIIIGDYDSDLAIAMPVAAGVDWYERAQYNIMQHGLNAVQSASSMNLASVFSNLAQISSMPQSEHIVSQSSGLSKLRVNSTTNNIVLYISKLAQITSPQNYAELMGTPLCEVRQIKTLSGYIKCNNASVLGTGIDVRDEINSYLNGGFFYE